MSYAQHQSAAFGAKTACNGIQALQPNAELTGGHSTRETASAKVTANLRLATVYLRHRYAETTRTIRMSFLLTLHSQLRVSRTREGQVRQMGSALMPDSTPDILAAGLLAADGYGSCMWLLTCWHASISLERTWLRYARTSTKDDKERHGDGR